MKFNPGDIVQIIGAVTHQDNIGKITSIISYVGDVISENGKPYHDIYHLELPSLMGEGYWLGARGCDLKLIYDGNQKTTWDTSVFKPQVLERME